MTLCDDGNCANGWKSDGVSGYKWKSVEMDDVVVVDNHARVAAGRPINRVQKEVVNEESMMVVKDSLTCFSEHRYIKKNRLLL
jgi:hypothetical protein